VIHQTQNSVTTTITVCHNQDTSAKPANVIGQEVVLLGMFLLVVATEETTKVVKIQLSAKDQYPPLILLLLLLQLLVQP
jgi:hypothetical protein